MAKVDSVGSGLEVIYAHLTQLEARLRLSYPRKGRLLRINPQGTSKACQLIYGILTNLDLLEEPLLKGFNDPTEEKRQGLLRYHITPLILHDVQFLFRRLEIAEKELVDWKKNISLEVPEDIAENLSKLGNGIYDLAVCSYQLHRDSRC